MVLLEVFQLFFLEVGQNVRGWFNLEVKVFEGAYFYILDWEQLIYLFVEFGIANLSCQSPFELLFEVAKEELTLLPPQCEMIELAGRL